MEATADRHARGSMSRQVTFASCRGECWFHRRPGWLPSGLGPGHRLETTSGCESQPCYLRQALGMGVVQHAGHGIGCFNSAGGKTSSTRACENSHDQRTDYVSNFGSPLNLRIPCVGSGVGARRVRVLVSSGSCWQAVAWLVGRSQSQ